MICWGYGGILSLGQGVFFGLGGYCMAMFLKLEASSVENTKIQSTPGIPDFMDWNQITSLPLFWKPFHSLTFTIAAVILVPGIFALIIGAAMFKRRVGGTYFAIITQAVAAILTILIVGQQGYTGGINGMTDLRTLKGWDIRPDHAKIVLYFVEVVLPVRLHLHRAVHPPLEARPHPGRDARAGGPGPLLRLQRRQLQDLRLLRRRRSSPRSAAPCSRFNVGFMSPSFVGIVPSIEMVIYTAVGGRLSILGAVYGTLLVNFAKTSLSGSFPRALAVRPGRTVHRRGAGLPERSRPASGSDYVQPRIDRLIASRKSKSGERLDRQFRRRRRAGGVRRIIMLIGHQPKEFLLAVEALTVSFDGFKAVNDLSFYVEENEIRVIIGPNGAGKTTVLDLICGKTKATSGSIQFRGQELTEAEGEPDRAGRRRPQVPDAVDLRRSHGVREPGDFLSARPHRVRRADLHSATPRCRTACMKSPR